jgi:hypothetical protein
VCVSSFASFFMTCIIVCWLIELLLLRLCVCYGVLLLVVFTESAMTTMKIIELRLIYVCHHCHLLCVLIITTI